APSCMTSIFLSLPKAINVLHDRLSLYYMSMTRAIKYLIVDDDDIDRMAIEAQAGKFPFFHKIAACSNPVEAIELIHSFGPDVLFVDIEMPGMTGLDLIRCLSGKVPAPVFITSHPDFALEGYEMEAFDYILKPLNSERFARCA